MPGSNWAWSVTTKSLSKLPNRQSDVRTLPLVVAIVGAECTGKTTLASSSVAVLRQADDPWEVVPEYLRRWCDQHQRTPQASEQLDIATQQSQSICELRNRGISVVADTTPLMTAIYSDVLFQDTSLYPFALACHRQYDLTLLTGLDLAWQPDGLQRDGVSARLQINEKLRTVLRENGLAHTVVYGQGSSRTQNALDAIAHHRHRPRNRSPHETLWKWPCETCADADCEHRLFSRLI